MFKSTDSISKRVNSVIKTDIELRGETWLVNLTYGECNDYAQKVVYQCEMLFSLSREHVRFETVARYIRQHKARIRAKIKAQESSQAPQV